MVSQANTKQARRWSGEWLGCWQLKSQSQGFEMPQKGMIGVLSAHNRTYSGNVACWDRHRCYGASGRLGQSCRHMHCWKECFSRSFIEEEGEYDWLWPNTWKGQGPGPCISSIGLWLPRHGLEGCLDGTPSRPRAKDDIWLALPKCRCKWTKLGYKSAQSSWRRTQIIPHIPSKSTKMRRSW